MATNHEVGSSNLSERATKFLKSILIRMLFCSRSAWCKITMPVKCKNPWNDLEIIRLCVSALTPIFVAVLGIYIHRFTKRFEHLQWRNQKLIEKRLSIYDELAPLFNDNFCYFTYVGSWKEFSPEDIIQAKRKIDKKIYIAAPLFSKRFLKTCLIFQDLCYEIYNGTGRNARLRTDFEKRKEYDTKPWQDSWPECFSKDVSSQKSIKKAYQDIMDCFSDEIGINIE